MGAVSLHELGLSITTDAAPRRNRSRLDPRTTRTWLPGEARAAGAPSMGTTENTERRGRRGGHFRVLPCFPWFEIAEPPLARRLGRAEPFVRFVWFADPLRGRRHSGRAFAPRLLRRIGKVSPALGALRGQAERQADTGDVVVQRLGAEAVAQAFLGDQIVQGLFVESRVLALGLVPDDPRDRLAHLAQAPRHGDAAGRGG